jgi:hypothetical protein
VLAIFEQFSLTAAEADALVNGEDSTRAVALIVSELMLVGALATEAEEGESLGGLWKWRRKKLIRTTVAVSRPPLLSLWAQEFESLRGDSRQSAHHIGIDCYPGWGSPKQTWPQRLWPCLEERLKAN